MHVAYGYGLFTGGLGAMLPIFKVLLEDQTVAQWMDRQVVEYRTGAKLAERSSVRRQLNRVLTAQSSPPAP